MPRTYPVTVYKYADLSDEAKARARDWWREASAGDNFFAEFVTDDFRETLKALGFDIRRTGRYLAPNDPRAGDTLQWSGFWSQGDGASFSGTWHASDCDPTELLADRPVSWAGNENREPGTSKENAELHRIAGEILACKAAGLTFVRLAQSGHYSHEMTMRIDDTEWREDAPGADDADVTAPMQGRFLEAARDLARAFYKALEAEYTYQNSDEQIAETIIANEYEFTAEGKRA
jgi:hypothetical protein